MIPDLNEASKIRKNATASLALAIAELDDSLLVTDALIRGKYKYSDPKLWKEYRLMRELGHTPSRRTGLRITIYHEGTANPFQGATALIRELKRSAVTDIDGVAEILAFRNGKYHLDLVVDEILRKTLIVEVRRGRIAEITEAI